ncbi:MAG: nuclear transport factor 2 family protein, partial [Rhodospirillaceae bacterium]|nr:nuclear transport factor 2 family protein [Rhodospirillaceae bacterium]
MDEAQLQAAVDRQEINELLMMWGQARDRAEWDNLRHCFQPDGTINIAWISGPASEFIDKSSERLAEFKAGEYSKHVISPGRIQLNGRRAISQCHVNHVTRVIVDGHEFDWEFWGQFHDLIEKREDNVWR